MTDEQLVGCFIDHRDEAAFEALLRRHGPMVLGVCRRVLRNYHDAEDAFQATFLILVRKAASLTCREAVANWLYGVAYRTALKARAMAITRRMRESQAKDLPESEGRFHDPCESWQPLLDQELSRLPPRYREPLVLCDLEGKTRKEAARQLGWPEGTVSGRLARARSLLAKRLSRQGVVLSGATLAVRMSQEATAAIRFALVSSTCKAARLLAAGQATAGRISAPVAALMEGVLKTMLLKKLTITAAAMLGIIALFIGVGGLVYRTGAAEPMNQGSEAAADTEEPQRGAKETSESPKLDAIVGTGKSATKDVKVSDFTSVEVQAPFRVDIAHGDTFRAAVTADDNLLEHVHVVKEGSVLKISLDTGEKGWRSGPNSVLKAAITMPTLEGVHLRAASRARVKGFKSEKGFHANVSGASSLDGDIAAGKMDFKVNGASKVTLRGSAAEVMLSATGASRIALGDLATAKASIKLSGASHATIHAKDRLDYTLNGASRLEYRGNPMVGKKETSGASSVSHK
jgi:RNA polymerase sigma factor (sigma-70 family)